MNQITLLVELQRLDTTLDENAAARAQLQAKLADTAALDSAHTAFQESERAASTLKTNLRSLELETSGLSDKLKQVSERLYSGRITNAKELAGYNQDEKMLARRKSELEDQSLVLMEQLETADKLSADKQTTYKKLAAETQKRNEKERAALAALDEADADLILRRDAKRRNLPLETLRLYDDLRATKKGRAVAAMKGDSCSACGTQVPSGFISRVKAGTEPVQCTSCGRILSA